MSTSESEHRRRPLRAPISFQPVKELHPFSVLLGVHERGGLSSYAAALPIQNGKLPTLSVLTPADARYWVMKDLKVNGGPSVRK